MLLNLCTVVCIINGHIKNDHLRLIKREEVPKGHKVTLSIRAMSCKCSLITNEIKSYRAWLNLHDDKQRCGVNYFETYALAVTWFAFTHDNFWYHNMLITETNQLCDGLQMRNRPLQGNSTWDGYYKGQYKRLCSTAPGKYLWPEAGRKDVGQLSGK